MATTLYSGIGRRKTAVARVRLVEKAKGSTVNNIPLEEYFPTVDMKTAVARPLELTSQADQWAIAVKVSGGGKVAQAGAVALGTARALLKVDPAWRKQLKVAGVLTRDARSKERKKPGLKRARRAPQFSKR